MRTWNVRERKVDVYIFFDDLNGNGEDGNGAGESKEEESWGWELELHFEGDTCAGLVRM